MTRVGAHQPRTISHAGHSPRRGGGVSQRRRSSCDDAVMTTPGRPTRKVRRILVGTTIGVLAATGATAAAAPPPAETSPAETTAWDVPGEPRRDAIGKSRHSRAAFSHEAPASRHLRRSRVQGPDRPGQGLRHDEHDRWPQGRPEDDVRAGVGVEERRCHGGGARRGPGHGRVDRSRREAPPGLRALGPVRDGARDDRGHVRASQWAARSCG